MILIARPASLSLKAMLDKRRNRKLGVPGTAFVGYATYRAHMCTPKIAEIARVAIPLPKVSEAPHLLY
jgi:hypothetical protein